MHQQLPNRVSNTTKYKYILTWSEAYGDLTYGWSFGSDKFFSEGCPEFRCFLTSRRNFLGPNSIHKFDAILFHQRSFTWKDAPNQRLRRKYQRYVHWMMESPAHLHYDITSLRNLSNFFNWSMSYRTDAKFPTPYGTFQQVELTIHSMVYISLLRLQNFQSILR